ncbi:MAG: cation transporter, partial [Candidatus Auribacterota bacterium]|nr:cation transporter [Candidatus Auribacterota bacterium]
MDVKQKTAAISTLLNLIFAILKFVMAGLSGSLVILAEAWHSLTDVFTSLLVYFSVSPRNSETGGYAEDKSKLKNRGNPLDNKIDWKNITLENWVSLIIGGLILFAAIGVASRIISKPPITISSPFAYGLLFLFFAGCSYVVSIFEVKIGKKYDSPALIADGLHSKSDMVGSLIAGFTMITIQLGINRLGINIDKIGAVIIIIFILIFSLETFINFWSALHGKHRWRDRIASGLISSAFEKQTWEAFSRKISHRLNWDHLSSETRLRVRQSLISLLALGALFLISLSSSITIGPSQEGIRERLGRLVNHGHPLEPGFHMKLPWPLENIIKVDSRTIKSMNIGNTANPSAVALLWTKQ